MCECGVCVRAPVYIVPTELEIGLVLPSMCLCNVCVCGPCVCLAGVGVVLHVCTEEARLLFRRHYDGNIEHVESGLFVHFTFDGEEVCVLLLFLLPRCCYCCCCDEIVVVLVVVLVSMVLLLLGWRGNACSL